jgi:hypothetical protein
MPVADRRLLPLAGHLRSFASELHPTKLNVAPVAEEDEELSHVRTTVGRAHPRLDVRPGRPTAGRSPLEAGSLWAHS